MTKRLQLVDQNKLTTLIDLLTKKEQTNQLMKGINNPDIVELEEKKNEMEKPGSLQSENIVQFMRKKNSLKRKHNEDVSVNGGENNPAENSGGVLNLQQISEKRLNEFFKKKSMKTNQEGRIRIGRENVNKYDLVYDLTHNAAKQYNISGEKHNKILAELKKQHLPASHIRNISLKNKYTKLDTDSDSIGASSSSGDDRFSHFLNKHPSTPEGILKAGSQWRAKKGKMREGKHY